MKRKICVVTGTRAEYGLLYWLMKGIQDADDLELTIIATGTHLSPEFGLTYKSIETDGFTINKKVEMILSADTPSAIAKSTGLGLIGFAEALSELNPDMLLVLGDRFELLAAAFSALVGLVPIVHIHGGETTQGAIDEAIRHSLTKMAYLHFVATEEYRKRVIQLGEHPDRVFCVGGMGVDGIVKIDLLEKEKIEKTFDFKFGLKNLLITFHPTTLENQSSERQFSELLAALATLKHTHFIFTSPNADTDGRIISKMIQSFVLEYPQNAVSITSMGQVNYLSTLQYIDAVIGNSSSGLTEVPSFKIGTINIGDRQKGRIKGQSVIDCEPVKKSIIEAIQTLYSDQFQAVLKMVKNPYGEGGASEKIINVLRTVNIINGSKKEFYDL